LANNTANVKHLNNISVHVRLVKLVILRTCCNGDTGVGVNCEGLPGRETNFEVVKKMFRVAINQEALMERVILSYTFSQPVLFYRDLSLTVFKSFAGCYTDD